MEFTVSDQDSKPEPEIRGGNRPADYVPKKVSGMFGHHEDSELEDGAESYGEQADPSDPVYDE
jgi:hypothetical protein